jgi:hypothetical protein
MLKKLVIMSGLLLTSLTANATLIAHSGYARDSASNIVTGGGLEWLKWDVTKGMSINSALATYTAHGWRLASNKEMAALFNTFLFGPYVFTDDNETPQSTSSPWSLSEATNYNKFIELFGTTSSTPLVCNAVQTTWCNAPTDLDVRSMAMFGTDANQNGRFQRAEVQDDYTYIYGDRLLYTPQSVALFQGESYTGGYTSQNAGVALVRTFDTAPVAVPTPGSIGLLALGLVALGHRRRQVLAR